MKINFIYSYLHDSALHNKAEFPKLEKLSQIKSYWKKVGRQILDEIEYVTCLKWEDKETTCYLTTGGYSYSDPLTVKMYPNAYQTIDTLTHELIHRILSSPKNNKKIKRNWNKLMKKYTNEHSLVRIHVVIHAIHKHILQKLFGAKRLKQEIKKINHPDYIRAWNIVIRDGSQSIIYQLTKNL